jgi:hypothetical protein
MPLTIRQLCRMLAIAEILAAPFKNALFAPENS